MTTSNQPVWLVTGASKGLGLATVRAAIRHGYRVAATSRDAAKLAQQVDTDAQNFLALETVLTDENSIASSVAEILDRFGRIDTLVNNAGYSILGSIEEISDSEARANFDINVFAVLNMLRAVLPVMRGQRSGHIINIGSISGSVGGLSTGMYSATKAAVILLSESLAEEVSDLGIHVTALCPGGFRTDFLDKSSSHHPAAAIKDYTAVHEAINRYGKLNGNQGGDPDKAGEVIVRLSQMARPPRRLYLGSDALRGIEYKLQEIAQSVEEHRHLSVSASFHL